MFLAQSLSSRNDQHSHVMICSLGCDLYVVPILFLKTLMLAQMCGTFAHKFAGVCQSLSSKPEGWLHMQW